MYVPSVVVLRVLQWKQNFSSITKQQQNDSKTNVGLFEVLTCDQHVIHLTYPGFKLRKGKRPQQKESETNEWQRESLDHQIPPPRCKLPTGFIKGLPTNIHQALDSLLDLPEDMWVTEEVSYEARVGAVEGMGLWMMQTLIYCVRAGRQR